MFTESDIEATAADKASNLRAIFEILSYIHADALKDNYKELGDRIEFALNLAEELIKGTANTGTMAEQKADGNIAMAAVAPISDEIGSR
ncbi:hypothetical protein [Sneathiella litorea]|uniref:Uncharacterized protein n=1 Tax=Sneathiella litorea TaxID=2606216 RepID=A0A6L8W5X8_9PROT|nr:hypothetical protein [Sneathiella litorea]MZR29893.1 hypothetical protein [Sneathiella litorea]